MYYLRVRQILLSSRRVVLAPAPKEYEREFPKLLEEASREESLTRSATPQALSLEDRARAKLKLTELLLEAGLARDAQEYWRDIVAKYPETSAAREAERLLQLHGDKHRSSAAPSLENKSSRKPIAALR